MAIHKEHSGVSESRNAGLDVATGEYIAFVDADDVVANPNAFKNIYEKAQSRNTDMVQFGCEMKTHTTLADAEKQDNSKTYHPTKCSEDVLLTKDEFLAWFARRLATHENIDYLHSIWSKLYRRDLIGDVRFNSHLDGCEDIFFILQIYERAKHILLTPDSSYVFYHNTEGLRRTSEHELKYIEKQLLLMDVVNDFYKRKNLSRYQNYIDKWSAWMLTQQSFDLLHTDVSREDPIFDKIASEFHREYLPYLRNTPKALFMILLFASHQHRLVFVLHKIKNKFL